MDRLAIISAFIITLGALALGMMYNYEMFRKFNKIRWGRDNKLYHHRNPYGYSYGYPYGYPYRYSYSVFPSSFHRMGILFDDGSEPNDPNKILTLYGRQLYGGSSQYEYYTLTNMGNEQTKIDIDYKKEFYDGDTIYIPELGKSYSVKIDKKKLYYW